ncbi:hypothetical protein PRZ48_000391 [Zasmidium cellare]|uniref:peptidylprolyl isomerase n=1 Tax=Zasmidium cellare TaxID=395010 RepID=A0ABR0EYB8_ZASCE|nr:hypothetical protein PRZ48_000391 [Zasmidium cellare]
MPPRKALSERTSNNNTMAQGNADGKRKRVEVDLAVSDNETDDDLDVPVKAQKSGKSTSASRTPSAPAFPTPPTSSARSGYESVYGAPSSSFQPRSQQHSEAERNAWLADGGDINEVLESSQDDAEGSDQLEHYGDLPTKIVGVRYYQGYANPGQQILIRREPGNPYDGNAIRIDNIIGDQIGHIPRQIAAKLAKYIDHRWLHMEGELAGEKGHFDCPLTLHMYGPSPDSPEGRSLQERMAADRLPTKALKEAERKRKQEEKERLAAARAAAAASKGKYTNRGASAGGGSNQPIDMADILEASERINPREVSDAADKLGISEENLKNMPMAAKPDGIKTQMLPYQLQALQWLLDQETPKAPGPTNEESVQLWTKDNRNGRYQNLATLFTTTNRPELASGGCLADDMGLGKTLEMISLLVADAGTGTTLVVAPLSVMSNWSGQIETHVKESHKLEVYTYHGAGRVKMSAEDFEKYDVVITTYQTLAMDYMPKASSKQPEKRLRPNGLYSVNWRRVILDEGHIIRNPKAKGTAACTALMARSRWVLTGTPIVNSLKDLYSLLRFIGITGGMQQLDIFNRVLVRPMKNGDVSATNLLKLIMKSFTLRRRKEMAFIDLKLPPLEEFVHRVDFTDKERERYEALEKQAKGVLNTFETKGTAATYSHLLEVLLRMRQCCNHWQLCGERVTNLLAQFEKTKIVALTPENKKALQEILQVQIESQEDCAICLETLHQPVITACGHSFGQECIAKVIETQHKCPMCRAELKDETSLVPPARECGEDAADDDLDLTQSSSKLEALMHILEAMKGNGNKTIIFSQWTRFLDIVQSRLDRDGYKYCRLDGTMSAQKRDGALQQLEEDKDTTVMLASLGVCAVGLNLTAANNVILSDTWWAPAIEDQAVDRVHRLGQQKETRVFRLVMDKSIEEQTLLVQKEKRKLMMVAFSEKTNKREAARNGRLADIRKLLA